MTRSPQRGWLRSAIAVAVMAWATTAPAQHGMYQDRLSDSSQGQRDMDDGQDMLTPMQPSTPQRSTSTGPASAGHNARSSIGEVGQRQTREDAFRQQTQPMARIDSRIRNRIQSRLRTRIDRTYDPQANATSPFDVATEETRAVGRPPR
jgi:hypothetical protein